MRCSRHGLGIILKGNNHHHHHHRRFETGVWVVNTTCVERPGPSPVGRARCTERWRSPSKTRSGAYGPVTDHHHRSSRTSIPRGFGEIVIARWYTYAVAERQDAPRLRLAVADPGRGTRPRSLTRMHTRPHRPL